MNKVIKKEYQVQQWDYSQWMITKTYDNFQDAKKLYLQYKKQFPLSKMRLMKLEVMLETHLGE